MSTYTVKEVAEFVGKSQETIRRDIRDGKLRARKNSRKGGFVIEEDDIYSAYPKIALKPILGESKKHFDQIKALDILNEGLVSYLKFVHKTLGDYLAGERYDLAATTITASAEEIKSVQGAIDYVTELKGFEFKGYPYFERIFPDL